MNGVNTRHILFSRSVDTDNLNAQSRNVQDILSRWRSREWRASAIAFREPNPAVAANPNVDIVKVRPEAWWPLHIWRLYQGGFDAIFCPGIHHRADYIGLRTRTLLRRQIPVIATVEGLVGSAADGSREKFFSAEAGHGVFCQKLSATRLARAERLCEMADHLIAISPFLQRMATARYDAKVSHVPLGIDQGTFAPRPRERTNERLRVVSAGHVAAHKRPDFFLALASRFPATDFVWFGDGELREPLTRQAETSGVSNVSYPGALASAGLARELANSDIFVLPSRSEGVPKVSLEAASVGLPQVVFAHYETPTVVDGVNGFVVWDDAQFADRLQGLIDDPALAVHMGRQGVRLVEDLSWDIVAPQWEDHIIECAESPLRLRPTHLLKPGPT